MAPVNVVISGLPSSPSTLCLQVGDSHAALPASLVSDALIAATGIPPSSFFLRSHAGLLRPHAHVTVPGQHTAFVAMCLRRALPGGKGGFGAMLRGGAAPSKKTSNFDACRDLQGRRLRHVRDEIALREFARARRSGEGASQRTDMHTVRKRCREETDQARAAELEDKSVDPEELEQDMERIAGSVESAVADAVGTLQSRRKRLRSSPLPETRASPVRADDWMMDYDGVSSSDSEDGDCGKKLMGSEADQTMAADTRPASAQIVLR